MVGVRGFEPPAPCSQSTYATRLRYTPALPAEFRLAWQATIMIITAQKIFVNTFFQIFKTFFVPTGICRNKFVDKALYIIVQFQLRQLHGGKYYDDG